MMVRALANTVVAHWVWLSEKEEAMRRTLMRQHLWFICHATGRFNARAANKQIGPNPSD